MKIYAALYNTCYHESADATISLHMTLKGARNAIRKHKKSVYNRWYRIEKRREEDGAFKGFFKWDAHKSWRIDEFEIQP